MSLMRRIGLRRGDDLRRYSDLMRISGFRRCLDYSESLVYRSRARRVNSGSCEAGFQRDMRDGRGIS